ncbi:MAG: Ribonucleoside-diphosphate reductase subunit beta, partial [Candidatus Magasanikbacteria bacterium GW2011_GWC2_40_17]
MILGKPLNEDMNLRPIKYAWAYDLYNQAVANTWFPHEIALGEDLEDWQKMTDDERHAVTFLLSFFNPSELIVNRTLALGVYPYLKAPEAHLYLAKQMWEEANHCMAFEYVLETFPVEREKLFNQHLDNPAIKAKEDFVTSYLNRMTNEQLDLDTVAGKQEFVRNLVAYNIVMEGIWFYSGFMVALSFRQRKQLKNFGSM